MFDGLFTVALKPSGAFSEALKARGFDPDRPEPEYPLAVWHDCLDVAWQQLYPLESRERAWWLLGERFLEGYLQTLVGRLIGAALPLLSARTFVTRSPRFVATGLQGAALELVWQGERDAVVHLTNLPPPSAHLTAGVVTVCMKRMKVSGVQLDPTPLDGGGCSLRIRWS